MALWRARWVAQQFVAGGDFARHAAILKSPYRFYVAMLLKLIPGLFRRPLRFALREGGEFGVAEFMTLYIYKEVFADRCYDLDLGSSVPTIIDVGANTGLFAIRMKQLYPKARILCFEPYPPNFVELERNLHQSSFTDVTPVMKGIGAQPGKAKLFVHRRNVGGHSLFPSIAGSDASIEVELIDIQTAIAILGGHCDLLKLDCEGGEYAILESLSAGDAQRVPRVIVEPTGQLYAIPDLKATMARLGYSSIRRGGLLLFEQQGNRRETGIDPAEAPRTSRCADLQGR